MHQFSLMYVARMNAIQTRPDVAPPAFLQLAGHPLRWRLLAELARSDRVVHELTALIGEPQNLISYHLGKLRDGQYAASLLALAGLRRLGLEHEASVVLDAEALVPAACQGIVGVTVRADDTELRELLSAIEDPQARAVATAERRMLAGLDGSCRTPIGGHARLLADGQMRLTGLVAREDGSFLLKRSLCGAAADAARIGEALAGQLRAESPADIFS